MSPMSSRNSWLGREVRRKWRELCPSSNTPSWTRAKEWEAKSLGPETSRDATPSEPINNMHGSLQRNSLWYFFNSSVFFICFSFAVCFAFAFFISIFLPFIWLLRAFFLFLRTHSPYFSFHFTHTHSPSKLSQEYFLNLPSANSFALTFFWSALYYAFFPFSMPFSLFLCFSFAFLFIFCGSVMCNFLTNLLWICPK